MKPPINICPGYWTREFVTQHPETLFVFTDNTDRTSGINLIDENNWYYKKYSNGNPLFYPHATSACIRGLKNAYPISVQKHYNSINTDMGNWQDSDHDDFIAVISKETDDIIDAFGSGKYTDIMYPLGGLFNGKIANLTWERVPLLRISAETALKAMELNIYEDLILKMVEQMEE